jgi:hypothetical protein
MKFASLPATTAARLMFSFGFGFFLSMFTRVVSNIVKQPIQMDLGLNEETISLALGASFFVTFALAQLPVGLLLDRYDPRKVNASLFLLAAAGAMVMAASESGLGLSLGRIMMGLGFAAGLMGSLKVYSQWFPRERLPTINSLQFMIGLLGAWSATKPVELMLRVLDWREAYQLFAAVTVLSAVIMVTVAPRHAASASSESLKQQLQGLLAIYRDGYFWRIAPWMCVSMGVAQGLNTLYVYSWLTDVVAYPASQAASGVALVTLVSAANFAVLGPLQETLGRRGFGPLALPLAGQAMAMMLLGVLALQVKAAVIPQWMAWTMMAGTATLAFAALSQAFPSHMIGRAYTAFNLIGFLATAAVQWAVGHTLDLFPRTAAGGAAAEGYQLAFCLLVACQFAGACWFLLAARLSIGTRTMLQKNPLHE